MNLPTSIRLAAPLATLLLPAAAHAQYAITWSTIDAGGVTSAAEGPYTLGGTAGQPDAHPAFTAPPRAITGGFWAGARTGQTQSCGPVDFNGDGNLDPDDLSDYIACYFGHVGGSAPCPAANFNGDANTDPDDLADYIAAYFAGCP